MTEHTLFFYGTLLHPPILHRVIHGPSNPSFPSPASSYVYTRPAILSNHRRHRVKGADYPAVVPASRSTVRGTLATGLTEQDVRRLDIFEGEEYERRQIKVRALKGDGKGEETVEDGEEIQTETYVWIAGQDRLEEGEWDFETFKREKMRFWIGTDGEGETGREEFGAVDAGIADAAGDGTGGRRVGGAIGKELEREHVAGREAVRSAV